MPISISKLPEVTNVKDNSFMLITQDGTTKRTMCDQFVTEEEARLDEFSPTVITSKSMSKTGEGDNIDYSSSVYDAPMKDVILKGKTMVNCVQEPSSQDVVLPYEFEDGQYVTINDTKESGALGVELKGQTLVNQLTVKNVVVSNISSKFIDFTYPLDVNKKYLLLYKINTLPVLSGTNPGDRVFKLEWYNGLTAGGFKDIVNSDVSTGNSKSIIIDKYNGEVVRSSLVIWCPNLISGELDVDLMILEYQEGMENWDIPYFEGMASCKMPILKTTGKNINKYSQIDFLANSAWHDSVGTQSMYGDIGAKSKSRLLFRKGTYFISVTDKTNVDVFQVVDDNENILVNNVNKEFTLTEDTFLTVRFRPLDYTGIMNISAKIQIEQEKHATTYEPYKSSSLSLPEEVVLRSLPNGVCDTFNTRTGVYTQRVGAMVLNGSDPISSRMEQTDNVLTTTSRCYLDYASIPSDISMKPFSSANGVSNKLICDILPVKAVVPNMQQDDIESVGQTTAGFSIRVKGKTIAECRQRLAEQPVTIQYELATPIITKINLSSTLKPWNTTTHIYSEIPENSLYPILSHSNPTYPVILKPSTKYSIVVNSYSNDHTNSAINFNLGGATASTTVGSRVTTITTPSTLSNELLTMSGRGNKLNNVMVIEGDVAGDEPYFEGICDCKTPILLNCGKNLFDEQRHSNPDNFFVHSAYWSIPIQLKGNTEYRFSYTFNNVLDKQVVMRFATRKWTSTDHSSYPYSLGQVLNKNITSNLMGKTESMSFVTPIDGLVYLHYYNSELTNSPSSFNLASWYTHILKDIQLEESSTSTQCEPYKSNTVTFNQKDDKTIVLRSLQNGVCDTLNVETGEYVQRIGEVVLDGSQDGAYDYVSDESLDLLTIRLPKIPNIKNDGVNLYGLLSNKYNSVTNKSPNNIYAYNGRVMMTKLLSELELFNTSDKIKLFLSQNPITVQYPLATPIVSTIDVQGFPYAYKDGHVQLSSGSIEQSLTPKVEYNIATNRGGQITQNTKSLIRQGKLLDDIEDKINQIIEATINDSIMLMKLRNK